MNQESRIIRKNCPVELLKWDNRLGQSTSTNCLRLSILPKDSIQDVSNNEEGSEELIHLLLLRARLQEKGRFLALRKNVICVVALSQKLTFALHLTP
jgi:hypothetical protein